MQLSKTIDSFSKWIGNNWSVIGFQLQLLREKTSEQSTSDRKGLIHLYVDDTITRHTCSLVDTPASQGLFFYSGLTGQAGQSYFLYSLQIIQTSGLRPGLTDQTGQSCSGLTGQTRIKAQAVITVASYSLIHYKFLPSEQLIIYWI